MEILLVILTALMIALLIPCFGWLTRRFFEKLESRQRRRTRMILSKTYNFYREKYPRASEKELLIRTVNASFIIMSGREEGQGVNATAQKSVLTESQAREIVEKTGHLEALIGTVIEKRMHPEMAPWLIVS